MSILTMILAILIYGYVRGYYIGTFSNLSSSIRRLFREIFPILIICLFGLYGAILCVLFSYVFSGFFVTMTRSGSLRRAYKKRKLWNGLHYPFIGRIDTKIINWFRK